MTNSQRFLTVIPDRFTSQAVAVENLVRNNKGRDVRRPTSGLQLSKETFATLRIVSSTGQNILMVDAGSKSGQSIDGKTGTDVYTNFILQQVTEERTEKSQVLETFGEPFIFLFGERPRVISFFGVLVNSFDFNWESEWWYNYDNYLRGTRCVENDARVFLSYDTNLVGGYILSASSSKSADDPRSIKFQFQMFVTNYSNFSAIGNPSRNPGYGAGAEASVQESRRRGAGYSPEYYNIDQSAATPKSVDPDADLAEISIGPNGEVVSPKLSSTISGLLGVARLQWAGIGVAVNTYLATTSGSDGVALPAGAAGTLDVDQPRYVSAGSNENSTGTITYSKFSDVEEEYVGSLDFFPRQSSPKTVKSAQEREEADPAKEVEDGIKEEGGVSIPDDQLGKLYSSVENADGGVCMDPILTTQDPDSVVKPTWAGSQNIGRYTEESPTPLLTNDQVNNPPAGQSGGMSSFSPENNS